MKLKRLTLNATILLIIALSCAASDVYYYIIIKNINNNIYCNEGSWPLVFDVDVSRRGRYHLRAGLLRWHVIEHVIAICDYRVHERLNVRSSCTGVCMVKAFIYSIARKIFELAD